MGIGRSTATVVSRDLQEPFNVEGQALQSHHAAAEESGSSARESRKGLSAVRARVWAAVKRKCWLAVVKHFSACLACAPEDCKRDREIVLAAVRECGEHLELAAEECRRDREIVLAAVRKNGMALRFAAEECKRDVGIVLAAVRQNGQALRWAAVECKADHEIVLTAVQQNGHLLWYAAEECKRDRTIVLAATTKSDDALRYAADDLLLDSTFASGAKAGFYIVKISTLSGRSTVVLAREAMHCVEDIIAKSCLASTRSGKKKLVHGTKVVPARAQMWYWPGLRPRGEVSEYQLVISAQ